MRMADSRRNDRWYAAQHKGAQATIARQQERIAELEARVAELEAKTRP